MTWSVRGIDDEVRETALAAARRSGKPVGEWLNEVIRDTAVREEPPLPMRQPDTVRPDIARIERELGALAERLGRLSSPAAAAGSRPARRPVGRVHHALDEIAAELDRHLDVPGRASRGAEATFVEERPVDHKLQSIVGALDALDQRLARMAVPPRAPEPARPAARPHAAVLAAQDDLSLALEDINRRQRALDPDRDPGPHIRPAARPVLASDMERHFQDLTARLDALGLPAAPTVATAEIEADLRALRRLVEDSFATRVEPLAEGVEDLRGSLVRIEGDIARIRKVDPSAAVLDEIARLRRELSEANPDGALRSLELGYGHVVERLDDLKRGAGDGEAVSRLVREVADLRAALAERSDAGSFTSIENKIAALGRRIDQLVAKRGEAPSLADIRKVVAEEAPRPDYAPLVGRFDALDERLSAIRAIESRLADLTDKLDAFEVPNYADSVSADRVTQDIALLHKRIERLADRPSGFEQGLGDVITRLDDIGGRIALLERAAGDARASFAEPPGHAAFADLGSRLDALADSLATPAQMQTDALVAAIEDKFARIAQHLEGGDDRFGALGAIEDSLVEIQHVLSGRAPGPDASHDVAREAVAEFVRLTRDAGPDRAIETLLGELHDLKDATRGLESRTADSLRAVQEALTSVAGLLNGRTPVPTDVPVVSSRRKSRTEDTRPLEPGSGKPADATGSEPSTDLIAAPQGPGVDAPKADVPPSRRADFIAAARRAAQAAQAARLGEQPATVATPADLDAAERRPGALARIGAALRGRGKPIAAIAAAIVLAGLATQLTLSALDSMRRTGLAPVIAAAKPVEPPARGIEGDPIATGSVDGAKAVPTAVVPKSEPAPLLVDPPGPTGSFSKAPVVPAVPAFVAPETKQEAKVVPEARSAIIGTARGPDAVITESIPPAKAATPALIAPPAEKIGPAALRQAALGGDGKASFEVGLRYAEGRGVPVDAREALGWFRRAADAGFVPAQYRLASALEKGIGGPKDLAGARRWYQAAAEKGNVRAMHNLGVIYANDQNIAAALPWFQKAADFGLKDSQFNLGIIYAVGSGVKQDFAVAYNWFALAAEQGDPEAAKKRDDLAQYLDKTALASARMAAQTWRVRTQDRAVNDETTQWTEAQVGDVSLDSAGERTSRVQTLLKGQGLFAGKIDGQVTPDLKTAVKAFQKKAGLKPTGDVDDALVRALTAKAT